jgi:hypothetical protein
MKTLILISSVSLAVLAGVFAWPPIAVSAEGQTQSDVAGMMKMPQTAEEHSAVAESYKQKAAKYRQDAETHRHMLAEYKKGAVHLKQGENPWVKKMRLHCEAYIADAERLAADADDFAKFHTMRAKELQGQ